MKNIILILVILFSLNIYSQTTFNKDFTVTKNDLELNTYDKDSTANALVIYESGNSYVAQEDFRLKTEIKRKIKILNKEGFNEATIEVHLYSTKQSSEKIEDIVATTYNLVNGTISTTNLNKKNVYTDKYDENHTLIKFALPNIKEGCVITYSYKISSPFMFKYKGWNFQDNIPTLYSKYKASIPGNYEYNIKLVGSKKLTVNESKLKKNCLRAFNGGEANCGVYNYVMEDIPAFIPEKHTTSKWNFLSRIEYELKTYNGFDGTRNNYTKSWKTVDTEFKTDKDIGKQLRKSINIDEFLSLDIINETDSLKKAENIYKYVQDNYTWNEEYKIFKDVSIKNLIKNKSGNVSSINILLHNLLKESGFKVTPVLLSTRNNGFATKIYPVISDFNYLINQVTINNKSYLLDATDNYLSFGQIPFRCLNGYGRLMDFKNGSKWLDIKLKNTSATQYLVELTLGDNDKISGKVISKTTGYHALISKKEYYPNTDEYLTKLENKYSDIEITEHTVSSKDKKSLNFSESYNVEYENGLIGDNIYLNPFLIKFFKENPFKLQERTYPIDFGYKDSYLYSYRLNINDKYTVIEKPKDLRLGLPNSTGEILFNSVVKDGYVMLVLKINFKKSVYAPEYYPYLKEFMNKIVDTQINSFIVLKKK